MAAKKGDLRSELRRYAARNGYPVHHFADAVCRCGRTRFRLAVDDDAGAAVRTCAACNNTHPIGDSADYLEDASLEECACPCGREEFEITAGVSLYDETDDVRWIYVGCRCPACGLAAVYADWKNEFNDYRLLLARV
jgi:hypothetical protein